jgi:serine/threonine-protein kinase RsbW
VLISMELKLPRDARYVGVMREVASCILGQLDTPADVVSDVQIAVTEACANAVRHAVGTAEYSVRFGVAEDHCESEIIDVGPGFAPPALDVGDGDGPVDIDSESGRGLVLIRALVDDLEFVSDGGGSRIRLTKRFDARSVAASDGTGIPDDLRVETD